MTTGEILSLLIGRPPKDTGRGKIRDSARRLGIYVPNRNYNPNEVRDIINELYNNPRVQRVTRNWDGQGHDIAWPELEAVLARLDGAIEPGLRRPLRTR